MKRAKFFETLFMPPSRLTLVQALMLLLILYLLFMSLEIPLVFKSGSEQPSVVLETFPLPRPLFLERQLVEKEEGMGLIRNSAHSEPPRESKRAADAAPKRKPPEGMLSGLLFNETSFDSATAAADEFSVLHKAAKQAWLAGKKLWDELESGSPRRGPLKNTSTSAASSCPNSITLSGSEMKAKHRVVELPCGMTLGSHVTVVGKPRWAHSEKDPKISVLKEGEDAVMVSQFFMELQGLKTVDGEDPPRILHFNPRLKGDWSGKPAIEQNTCYRMQWGNPLRCEGWSSRAEEETVDGQVKCEKWLRDNDGSLEDSTATWWLNRLIGRKNKMSYNWPFPFTEGKLFVLTLRAGMEGYHIHVDGRHITSFPYRTGFVLEDATGVTLNGDVDVHSVFAASLPATHPSFAPQQHLEMFSKWQAPQLPDEQVELFIGILSAGNHFAERMAVRKTWMQHALIRSSVVVARFFVALSGRKEINSELKKEAEFFGDIVIVPYMDHYDLVVLKTVAICEYGVRAVAAKYIMKCDDDTFVRVDAVIKEAKKVPEDKSLYVGNINYYHKPLRNGKWAVTYEEWPEEEYPPYANGPGYILSSDIAKFIVAEFESHKLKLFKMEDVSMGMWVEKFNSSKPVGYLHSLKFCQFGCIEEYYTAHYQSPRQMICLWDKLHQGKPQCCNMR